MKRVNGQLPWIKWGNYYWERQPHFDGPTSWEVASRYATLKDALIPPGDELVRLLESDGPHDGEVSPILHSKDYWTSDGRIASLINGLGSIGNPPSRVSGIIYISYVIYCRPLDHKHLQTSWLHKYDTH